MLHKNRASALALTLTLADAASAAAQDTLGRAQIVHAQEGMIWAVMMPLAFITAICGLVYLARTMIEHRRWLFAVKLQTDTHTKIVDRLSGSEELLGYLQSPSGQRAFSLTPALDAPRGVAAPVSRILWSVQTGIVLALAGTGLWIGAGRAVDDIAEALRIIAIVTTAVGVGFVLSAGVSLVLSQRLGLIDAPAHRVS
jgi:hypothetical protein